MAFGGAHLLPLFPCGVGMDAKFLTQQCRLFLLEYGNRSPAMTRLQRLARPTSCEPLFNERPAHLNNAGGFRNGHTAFLHRRHHPGA